MKLYIKIILYSLIGAGLGFGYYYFIGCNTGSCPITSNWEVSTLYGAGMGLILALPLGKKKEEKDSSEKN